ncbi:MAG TPA: hypothetical protein VMH35_19915 [Streptosporangiaceae bacterium]|nr:hypothetical protein [Streptosporangiaceae bacterium]
MLRETAEQHGRFEAIAPPHDWWDWYAAYMLARESGRTPDEASAAAGRYMAEVTLGAWLGRNLTGGVGIVAFIATFAAVIGMRFAARRSTQLTAGLLGAPGSPCSTSSGCGAAPTPPPRHCWPR